MHPLKIGNVIGVGGEGIEVLITADGTVIEHEGWAYPLGQLGSYVTVPADDTTIVGFITRIGRQDTTTTDVEPEMIMNVQLLGTIKEHRFTRGVTHYPVPGDDVWIAVHRDFETIFSSFDQLLPGIDHPISFPLGRFALNTDFHVNVLGSEFFAKHAAILGNSGSGKSVTTAKIISEATKLDSSQVIMFDMHGEYAAAFSDENGNLNDNVIYLSDKDLVLPYWMLRYEEMESLLIDRSDVKLVNSQISFLKLALQRLKSPAAVQLGLRNVYSIDTPLYFSLEMLRNATMNFNEARYITNAEKLAFARLAQRSMEPEDQEHLMWSQRCLFNKGNAEGETPHPYFNSKILGLVNQIESLLNDRRYDFLLKPMQQAAQSHYFKDVIKPDMHPADLSNAMGEFIKLLTGRQGHRKNLVIVDLSGIPFEVVDIVVAVMTRMLFDFNFWSPPDQRHPLVLVYEEAHNYIPRDKLEVNFARRAVERVAKEGRKYGVAALVISQRPSELSETVLAQCNNMVIMRMNNPDDQNYITRVVSDQFAGVISMLPVLRPGEGFVVGDSVLMPLRTLIDAPERMPRSGNVDFFKHWSNAIPDCPVEAVLQAWWRQERIDTNVKTDKAPPPGEPAKPAMAGVT